MDKKILEKAKNIEGVMNGKEEWDIEFFNDYIFSEIRDLIKLINRR